MARRSGRRLTNGKAPSGHPLKGSSINSGGPSFLRGGASGQGRSGGQKITKAAAPRSGFSRGHVSPVRVPKP